MRYADHDPAAGGRIAAPWPCARLDVAADGALDLAAGLLAPGEPDARLGRRHRRRALGGLARLATGGLRGDQREVDPAADDRDIVDLDGDLVAQADRGAGPPAGQPHVDLVEAELIVAQRLELDQSLDERLLELDERAEA